MHACKYAIYLYTHTKHTCLKIIKIECVALNYNIDSYEFFPFRIYNDPYVFVDVFIF